MVGIVGVLIRNLIRGDKSILSLLIIKLIEEYIIRKNNSNGVKHLVVYNDDDTVTVSSQVFLNDKSIHTFKETADKTYLKEIKKDHKLDGKEFLTDYKLK